tara:strand:- start:82 stop:522 length:441 start_codon:yes stop_codon:yes gene_type:complete
MNSNESDAHSTPPAVKDAPLVGDSKRVGRPPKPKKRGVGRPKGNSAILAEYQERMLNSPKSRKVLDKVFDIALDDDHKHQAVCIKLVVDRLVPMSHFEKEKAGGISGITITMASAGGDVNINTGSDAEDEDERDITEYYEDTTDGE